ITISDNGIGMSRDEVTENLGTIAKSGTAQLMQKLTGDQKKDAQCIGQFGVGFYPASTVAEPVGVTTPRAGVPANESARWEFTVESVEKAGRGMTVELHLKEDALEFADHWRLRSIIKKYSDHIAIPVVMEKPTSVGEDAEKEEPEDEVINTATALWTRSRSDV